MRTILLIDADEHFLLALETALMGEEFHVPSTADGPTDSNPSTEPAGTLMPSESRRPGLVHFGILFLSGVFVALYLMSPETLIKPQLYEAWWKNCSPYYTFVARHVFSICLSRSGKPHKKCGRD